MMWFAIAILFAFMVFAWIKIKPLNSTYPGIEKLVRLQFFIVASYTFAFALDILSRILGVWSFPAVIGVEDITTISYLFILLLLWVVGSSYIANRMRLANTF